VNPVLGFGIREEGVVRRRILSQIRIESDPSFRHLPEERAGAAESSGEFGL